MYRLARDALKVPESTYLSTAPYTNTIDFDFASKPVPTEIPGSFEFSSTQFLHSTPSKRDPTVAMNHWAVLSPTKGIYLALVLDVDKNTRSHISSHMRIA